MAQLKDGPGEGEPVVTDLRKDLKKNVAVSCDEKVAGLQAQRLEKMKSMGLFNRAA